MEMSVSQADACTMTPLPLPPAADADPHLVRLWQYWNERRGDRLGPRRAEIDPAEIRDLLPGILIIEPVGDPPRFRYRLSGTASDEIHGRAITGTMVDMLSPPSFATQLGEALNRLLADGRPQLSDFLFTNAEGHRRRYQALRLPLSEDGGTVSQILVFATFRMR